MNIYRHPNDTAIIITNNTHCIYQPLPRFCLIPNQVAEAITHLNASSPRCFLFDPTLTDQFFDPPTPPCQKPGPITPDRQIPGPDFENGETDPVKI